MGPTFKIRASSTYNYLFKFGLFYNKYIHFYTPLWGPQEPRVLVFLNILAGLRRSGTERGGELRWFSDDDGQGFLLLRLRRPVDATGGGASGASGEPLTVSLFLFLPVAASARLGPLPCSTEDASAHRIHAADGDATRNLNLRRRRRTNLNNPAASRLVAGG